MLDRFFEQRKWYTNTGFGVMFGVAAWLLASPFMPSPVDKSHSQLQNEVQEIVESLNVDPTKEFPGQSIMRFRRDMLGKIHMANDRAEVKRQQEEVQRLRERLEREKEMLLKGR